MQPKILVSKNRGGRDDEIWKTLLTFQITPKNPDLFILEDEKIGIAQIKQIIKHFSTKPFGSTLKSVVIFDAGNISIDAQNAMLKILEEPPENSIILIGVDSETRLLPTVLSRCLVISLQSSALRSQPEFDLDQILKASVEERFEIVEKASDKDKFLEQLIDSYRHMLQNPDVSTYSTPRVEFLEDLLNAQIWKESNVNIRTILEYLMLKL